MKNPKDYLSLIYEFRTAFGQNIVKSWADRDDVACRLQAKLIAEEAVEYNAAKDRISILDGLGDTAYVVFGASAACGITPQEYSGRYQQRNPNVKVPIFDVTNGLIEALNNDKKPCYTAHWKFLSQCYWRLELASMVQGVDLWDLFNEIHSSNMTKFWHDEEILNVPKDCSFFTNDGGKTFIVKNKDGKIVKSPSYRPANLENF